MYILLILTILNIVATVLCFMSSVNTNARLEEIQKEQRRVGEFYG